MGQQQILLIVLSVIIVGIAVSVGITMFRDQALQSNKDSIISDLNQMAVRAQQYYMTPTSMGGGGSAYTGLADANLGSAQYLDSDIATYTLTVTDANNISIKAVGKVGSTGWTITGAINNQGTLTISIDEQAIW